MALFKKDPHTPDWVRWLVGLFLLYMVFVGYVEEKDKTPDSISPAGEEEDLGLKNYPEIKEFFSIDRWHRVIDPEFASDVDYEEIREGTGDIAMCGQQVTVKITYLEKRAREEGIEDYYQMSPEAPEEPITFIIGDGTTRESWQLGVRGMKLGGTRFLAFGPKLVWPHKEFDDVDAPMVPFLFELKDLSPRANETLRFSSETIVKGIEPYRGLHVHASCGDEIAFLLRLYNAAGVLLYDSQVQGGPFVTTVGQGEFGHGIDRGLFGMKYQEARRLMIPPSYQNDTDSGLPFPRDEIAIVELLRIPYTEEQVDDVLLDQVIEDMLENDITITTETGGLDE